MLTLRFLAVLICAPAVLAAQTQHETVRGRVTSDSGRAVPDADVIVTRISDRVARIARTGPDGAYRVDWTDGNGDYAVTVSASGFQPRSLHAVRTAADSVIVVDVQLAAHAQQLAAVVTRAPRAVVDRDPARYAVGSVESAVPSQNAARRLAPDQAGDLSAIAAMLPGVSTVSGGGISVLGLPSSQNSVVLNGLAFAGSDVPRDATAVVRVQASSYDPANGWFSGAQTLVDLVPGSQFTTRTGHWTLDAPALQYADAVSSRSGQRFSNLAIGIGGTGQLLNDAWSYNYGVQGARRSAAVASLLTADADLLAHAGVAPDSARRLLALLEDAGVPASTSAVPSGALDESASFIGRIDHAPYDWTKLAYNPTTFGIQGYGRWSRTGAQALSATGTPAHGGSTTQTTAAVTGFFSHVFGSGYLADLRTGVTVQDQRAAPYLALPDGRARVVSLLPDGTTGSSTLQFGGNARLATSARSWRWETGAQVQFYPPGAATHRVKLAADARYDAFAQDVAADRLGTYTYTSLAALAAGSPASFTRTLVAPTQRTGVWNAFVSLGDLWRVNPGLQLMYGARVDGNLFTRVPTANQAVAAAFGARTDHAPNTVGVSPRLGFTWQRQGGGRIVRGGVGQFRNAVDASTMAAPSAATGLPGSQVRIACVGDAVPAADWNAFLASAAAIPATCAGGSGPLAEGAPEVQLLDSRYRPSRSWRANLGFQSSVKRTVYTIEEIASLNLDQPGILDRNLAVQPAFRLAPEQRPVYVPASSIVASTGAVSPTLARENGAFSRVTSAVSDLRSVSQATLVTVRPFVPGGVQRYFGDVSLSYTWQHVRAQQRGFDGAGFDDPRAREWGRGDLDVRHTIVGQAVLRPFGDGRAILFIYGRAQSGAPFTPMVGGSDVNGDGLANDRAFVFDPGAVTDSSMARQMRSLLSSAPGGVRECLQRQLGSAAARNSCEGPWTAQLNASLQLSGPQLLHMPRTSVRVNFANPLGAIDRLLHGSDPRGWGTPASPDRALYTVRGFTPSSGFLYDVNQRFGSTRPSASTQRAPFRITLDVSVDLARPLPAQMLDRWMRPGRGGQGGERISAVELTRRLRRTVPDPYAALLQQGDSLLLTDEQVTQLQAVADRYRAAVDAKWTNVADELAALGDRYDEDAAARRVDSVTDDVWELTRRDVQEQLPVILAPVQTAQLTGFVGMLFRARDRVHIRLAPTG